VAVTVGLGVGVGPGVDDGVSVGLAVVGGSAVGLAVACSVPLELGDGIGEAVAVGAGLPVAMGAELLFCGSGKAWTMKSMRLSSVSWLEPADPPASRSRLLPAAGAAAARVSSHELVAFPHPTASRAIPAPTTRSATLPPVAASPFA